MKRIIAFLLTFIMILSTNVFAYRWIENNSDWYVYDESNGSFMKEVLLDTGNNVYYLDKDGKAVTGWWRNPTSKKLYFFSNKPNNNYAGMLFGLHMIDGYYFYFGDDGSLQTSEKNGQYRNVYEDFYADHLGLLYYDNVLMKDTSISQSEFYTNLVYYTNVSLNNFFLANYDITDYTEVLKSNDKSDVNMTNANNEKTKTSASNTSGGTNYTVDAEGRVHIDESEFVISDLEKFGPGNR